MHTALTLPVQVDEQQVIEHSAVYPPARQPAIDLHSMIDLDDMVAAFDGYRTRLRQPITGP